MVIFLKKKLFHWLSSVFVRKVYSAGMCVALNVFFPATLKRFKQLNMNKIVFAVVLELFNKTCLPLFVIFRMH